MIFLIEIFRRQDALMEMWAKIPKLGDQTAIKPSCTCSYMVVQNQKAFKCMLVSQKCGKVKDLISQQALFVFFFIRRTQTMLSLINKKKLVYNFDLLV